MRNARLTSSAAKIAANRANAAKSSGPSSSEGRAVSSMNALAHGLRAETPVLLACERADVWDRLFSKLIEEHQPVGATEELLVEQLASASWRRWRADSFENGTLLMEGAEEIGLGKVPWRDAQKSQSLNLIMKYRRLAETSFTGALHELQRMQAARRGISVPVPTAVDVTLTVDGADRNQP